MILQKKLKGRLASVLFFVTTFLLLIVPVLGFVYAANEPTNFPNPIIKNPLGQGTTVDTLDTLIVFLLQKIAIPIGAVIVVLGLFYAGFKYVTAGGNPGEIEKAHSAFLYVVVGALLILGSVAISYAVQGTVDSILPAETKTK